MAENGNSIIEMHNVGIRYDQGPEILSDIKLSLKKGSFHFLTGKSGAGKTSLLSMMYLWQRPSRGSISVFGKDINFTNRDSLASLRRRIGVVFQEVRKRVGELLSWVELDRHMLDTASTLSGGEKQRVAIARAVINRPELLLADEPTGNVDNFIAPKLMKLFVELNKLGTTVVIATHSDKLINDFAYPRLHLQNRGLHILYPSDKSGLGGSDV